MTFRIRPEARADIVGAARWYEDREAGLGIKFIAEIDTVFQRIEQRPERYAIVHCGVRRVLVRHFPYAVYFGAEAEGTIVLAVLHQRLGCFAPASRS
jgi:toxin ParE1/3/4